jgi:cyanophycinase
MPKGTLILIGGREDKQGRRDVLKEVVRHVREGKLLVATLATRFAAETWEIYYQVFRDLGVRHVEHLSFQRRTGGDSPRNLKLFDAAQGIFFTGGNQLRLTKKLEGTETKSRLIALYAAGGVVAGTSAGASALGEVLLVPQRPGDHYTLHRPVVIARGLGLARGLIVDQHFSQRGRLGRLIVAVAQNARYVGVGIDENTAAIVRPDRSMCVVGEGLVHVVEGGRAAAELTSPVAPSLFDMKFHLVSSGKTLHLP